MAGGEQEVDSCLQILGVEGQVSGPPSDPTWCQASPAELSLPCRQGPTGQETNRFPSLVSTQVPSACLFSLVPCALDAACSCSPPTHPASSEL